MLNLNTLYKNHFGSRKISDDKLRKFAEINLERLKANNGGGELDQLIADTTAALQMYEAAITDEDVKYAKQQGLTIKVKNILKDFKELISRGEGIIRGQFGKKVAEYQEFFPYQKDEYWQCSLKNADLLMDRFLKAAEKYAPQIGDDLKNKLQAMLTDFKSAREEQLLKKAEVTDGKTTTSKRRKELEIQLMKNLYYIGYLYPGNIDKCNNFFDQSFLRKKRKSA